MVGIVAVFLVIGGVVIMNVMLATVTERTREIGLRKSLGARRADILLQFLTETAVMSTIGGAIGVAVAYTFVLSVVTAFEPNALMVDEQKEGPFKKWVHSHRLEAIPEGTRMLDRVYARLPPELLRVRLLAALGRCSAGAVNTSGEGAQNGRIGQQVDDATSGKLAPRAGIEPATHGLTVRCSAS